MKYIISTLVLLSLALSGCKQDVEFGAADSNSSEVSSGVNPPVIVDPEDPDRPTEPVPVQGPIVKIVQPPKDHKSSGGTEVIFEVIEGDNELSEVICFVDKKEIDCGDQVGVIEFSDVPLGQHTIEIVAVDVDDLKGQAREKWTVFNSYKRQEDNLNIKKGERKTDILFVIDNSSSMRYEQTQMSQRFENFMDKVKNLDWQIAITTTEPLSKNPWGDGKIDPFPNSDWFLTPDLGLAEAQKQFSRHVRRSESGWDTEMGIRAVYRAIERSVANRHKEDRALNRFFRKDAVLSVVVVSDEDESGDGIESEGDELIELVRNTWGANKVFQWNSIIVHTRACLLGSGYSWGVKYEGLSRKTKGVVGDVCARDYSQLLSELGDGVAKLQKTYELSCVPQDTNEDGKVELKVIPKSGQKVPGFTIDKTTVVFDEALEVGKYDFEYYCLED